MNETTSSVFGGAKKTTTDVSYPIIAAMVKAEEELGPCRQWLAHNDHARHFLAQRFAAGRCEVGSIPEIKSAFSHSHEAINHFLAAQGFPSMQLRPFDRPEDFGVASILKLALQWASRAERTQVYDRTNNVYPAVRMKSGNVAFLQCPGHPYPIALLKTTTEDQVFLTMMPRPVEEPDLCGIAEVILRNSHPSRENFSGLIFPMIDLDVKPDITWLLGTETTGADNRPAVISQALQQTRLQIDEVGAVVQSAVALAVSKMAISLPATEPHIINQPFLAVVNRPSLTLPIFVGYLDYDCWQQPAR